MTFILFGNKDHTEIEGNISPEGSSFACKNLAMVKIKCPKEDERVHVLAQFFVDNGIAMEKISFDHRPTRQTRESCILTVSCKSLALLLFWLNHTKATKFHYICKVSLTLLLLWLNDKASV
jgi:hypothetical protein